MSNTSGKEKGYISLRTVVYDVLNDLGTYSQENFKRYMRWAIRGFGKLNIETINSVEVKYYYLDAQNSIDLPDDYLYYTKVGIKLHDKIWTLSVNDNLAIPTTEQCGQTISDLSKSSYPDLPSAGYYFADHYYGSSLVTNLFSYGGGFNVAYFREDKAKNKMWFQGSVPDSQIILEYKSSGVGIGEATVVPRVALEALIAYVHWQRLRFSKVSLSEKYEAKKQFLVEQQNLQDIELAFTMDEFLDALWSTSRQTVKR